MLRRALFQSSRLISSVPAVRAAPVLRLRTPIISQSWRFQAARCYAASAGLSKEEITGRVLELLKNFDKVFAPLIALDRHVY
jgi:NADH dehydrogenase (ubiquinone) 1 alpha/beta subcomplex 1